MRKSVRMALCAILASLLGLFPVKHLAQSRIASETTAARRSPSTESSYIGSRACADCHRAIYNVYLQTDMGRSMSVVSNELLATIPNTARLFDATLNRQFEVSVNDGNLYQTDYETLPDGKDAFRDTRKIEWIIGAGANGFGGIVRRGDTLFEAPLSFYSKTQSWALSPGYQSYDFGFSRPIAPQCIACHSGRPQAVPDGNGRFLDPPFAELAVGCENCHGPGASHESLMHERGVGQRSTDLGIVNPATLPSWLADNICMSCHQTGDARVLQPGKTFADFRPGAPLNDTLAIFMVPPKRGDPPRGDLLQHYFSMTLSKCYRNSQRKLSCITCHDPHVQPDRQVAPVYFRTRCLTCHTEMSCTVPSAVRRHRDPPDDCVGCHMPKRDLKEISHSALTNHRILRETGEPYPDVAFRMTTPELPDLVHVDAIPGRNRAAPHKITLLRAYGQLLDTYPEYRKQFLALARQLGTSAPENLSVLEALAYDALAKQDRDSEARATNYLIRAIQRGSTLPVDFEQCARLLMSAGKLSEATDVLQHGIQTIPHDGELYRLLGNSYLSQNKGPEAVEVLTRASKLFPENTAIRVLLARSRKAASQN